jgi:aldose 1-epimerase
MNRQMTLPGKEDFQRIIDDKPTDLYILKNSNGLVAAITNFGARWVSMFVPGNRGEMVDVLVGFDSVERFKDSSEAYYGAIIGRFANRIAKGKFSIDGRAYSLATNNGVNHLHGGPKGFHNVVWNAEQLNDASVLLTYYSPDGEEGYPGNLQVELTYTLTEGNELHLQFKAVTDNPTIINLTNHAYFNLNGVGSGSIEEHLLEINADHFTPIDETSIPLGSLVPVENTAFDFRQVKTIGAHINNNETQLKNGKGYDHNFVLNKNSSEGLGFAARAKGNETGIVMEVYTKELGIQLYTGNFMKGNNEVKPGARDAYRSAFCLETQHFPDSPNHPAFPSVLLLPEDVYFSETIFKFKPGS